MSAVIELVLHGKPSQVEVCRFSGFRPCSGLYLSQYSRLSWLQGFT